MKNFTFRNENKQKSVIQIIHIDDSILIVNKPAGLVVIPDHWDPEAPNLMDLLQKRLKKIVSTNSELYVVHRIDKDTSGLVILARSPEIHHYFNDEFSHNRIKKSYLAIVNGIPNENRGKIDAPILYSGKGKVIIHASGKPSVTEFTVMERFRHYALLQINPLTGRTHQIRVHLKSIGHPLAIDPIYGNRSELSIFDIKWRARKKEEELQSSLMSRLSLHSWRLEFNHPGDGRMVYYQIEPPKDFRALLNALKKWDL